MITIETATLLVAIFGAMIAFIGVMIAFWHYRGVKEEGKKANEIRIEDNRPILTLSELKLFPEKFEVYAGVNAEWGTKNLIVNSDYEGYVTSDKYKRKTTLTRIKVKGKNERYLFVNACPKTTKNTRNAIFALDALYLKIDFEYKNGVRIKAMGIKDVYSMYTDKENFGVDHEANTKKITIPSSQTCAEIPVAYACIDTHPTSMKLQKIYDLKQSGQTEPIDFIETPDKAGDYIGFAETGYLIECTTIDKKDYLYSLIMEKDYETEELVVHPITFDSDTYYKAKNEAMARSMLT